MTDLHSIIIKCKCAYKHLTVVCLNSGVNNSCLATSKSHLKQLCCNEIYCTAFRTVSCPYNCLHVISLGYITCLGHKIMEFWKEVSKKSVDEIGTILNACIAGLIPDSQERWAKGMATVVLANTLVCLLIFKVAIFAASIGLLVIRNYHTLFCLL